ncbi:MAG: hypothetical protein WAM14_11830 [Candidatus Nitrosopolaris sp.]
MTHKYNTVRAQQQRQQQLQLTSQGSPVTIIPGLTQNVLTIGSIYHNDITQRTRLIYDTSLDKIFENS